MRNHSTGSARIILARDFHGPAFALVPGSLQPQVTGCFRRLRASAAHVVLTNDEGIVIKLHVDDRILVLDGGAS